MFWRKKEATTTTDTKPGEAKLPGPKDIPPQIGSRMVTQMQVDPKLVWDLKAVMRPFGDNSHNFDVRLYKQSHADDKKVKVKNYNSLNDYPKLILFEGTWDKKNQILKLDDKRVKAPVTS